MEQAIMPVFRQAIWRLRLLLFGANLSSRCSSQTNAPPLRQYINIVLGKASPHQIHSADSHPWN